ncbi:MAG: Ig-like domain-containing protein [Clostridiales bacterium]|nr:Ig-like domain-containing protein [Clostridiales bacterium]
MVTVKKQTLGIVTLLLALAVALTCFGVLRHERAYAYDGLPGEFGNKTGTVTVGNATYDNYERGYEKKEDGNVVAHVGGKNMQADGTEILIDAATMTSIKNWDTLVDANSEGNRVAYGIGWNADAARKVGNAFKAKWESLISQEYNIGIPMSNIELYQGNGAGDAVAFGMHFRYGDSVYQQDDGNGGVKNHCYLVYNAIEDEVFLITDGFARLQGETRRIGAPVSEQLNNIKVTGWDGEGNQINKTNATVQVFETGMLIANNMSGDKVADAVKHEGVVEKISDTEYKMHPLVNDQDIFAAGKGNTITADGKQFGFIGDVDGTWHALRTARTSRRSGDNKLVVQYNMRAGCLEVVYNDDYTLFSRMAYAGQNFAYDAQGNATRVALPFETFTTDEHLWEGIADSGRAMYRGFAGNADKTDDDLKNVFRAGYKTLFDSGVIAGYRCSPIKEWTVLCLDYKYSPDSGYGFDGVGSAARERMFTLVYSHKQGKVYGVGDDIWQVWKDDNTRPALGAPISNAMQNKTIASKTFRRIQIFEKGYVYENASGKLVVEYGATTDNDYTKFIYDVAPNVPTQYGSQIGSEEVGGVTYVNYARGAVKATPSSTGMGYVYNYYPGRNFEISNGAATVKMLSFEQLYNESDFTCAGVYDDIFEDFQKDEEQIDGVKTQMIARIRKMLEEGFFPGFLDTQGFSAWNNCACQQMFYGDSTAQPWGGDARTNVGAFIWNERLNKLFYLKDAFMDGWAKEHGSYEVLGAPASDAFTLADNPNVIFQKFEDTKSKDGNALAVAIGYNEATHFLSEEGMTPEIYIATLGSLSDPITGITITPPEFTEFYLEDVEYMDFDYVIEGGAADAEVIISSSDESIAKVMADGTVEFYKAGKVTITVSVSDGVRTFKDSVTFQVRSRKKSGGCGSRMASTSIPLALAALALAAVCFVKKGAKARK